MSFWGATVITNLLSAIPWIGTDFVLFVWGGFSVIVIVILFNYSQVPLPLYPMGFIFNVRIGRKRQAPFIKPTAYVRSVLHGLLLSDAWFLRNKNLEANSRIGFRQSIKHFQYQWFVFTILKSYCNSFPRLVMTKYKGKTYFDVEITTRSLPLISDLWKEWCSTGVKRQPSNMYEILTPVALAHWIMGDGNSHNRKSLVLATDGFTQNEIIIQCHILQYKYDFIVSLHSKTLLDGSLAYRIQISKYSMDKLITLVKPHFHSSMYRKLSL